MPETSDGKKYDYTKLGMMKAKMHQQRLDRNNKSMGNKSQRIGTTEVVALSSVPVGVTVGAYVLEKGYQQSPAYKREQLARERWNARVADLDKQRVNNAIFERHSKALENYRKSVIPKDQQSGKKTSFGKGGGGVGGFGKFSTINRSSRSGNKLKLPPKDFI